MLLLRFFYMGFYLGWIDVEPTFIWELVCLPNDLTKGLLGTKEVGMIFFMPIMLKWAYTAYIREPTISSQVRIME